MKCKLDKFTSALGMGLCSFSEPNPCMSVQLELPPFISPCTLAAGGARISWQFQGLGLNKGCLHE